MSPQPKEISRREFVQGYGSGLEAVPLHLCPGNCSGWGYCSRMGNDQAGCNCFAGRTGQACE